MEIQTGGGEGGPQGGRVGGDGGRERVAHQIKLNNVWGQVSPDLGSIDRDNERGERMALIRQWRVGSQGGREIGRGTRTQSQTRCVRQCPRNAYLRQFRL